MYMLIYGLLSDTKAMESLYHNFQYQIHVFGFFAYHIKHRYHLSIFTSQMYFYYFLGSEKLGKNSSTLSIIILSVLFLYLKNANGVASNLPDL